MKPHPALTMAFLALWSIKTVTLVIPKPMKIWESDIHPPVLSVCPALFWTVGDTAGDKAFKVPALMARHSSGTQYHVD